MNRICGTATLGPATKFVRKSSPEGLELTTRGSACFQRSDSSLSETQALCQPPRVPQISCYLDIVVLYPYCDYWKFVAVVFGLVFGFCVKRNLFF